MTALQWIIKEAKVIRKKSPKMEWKKAVAQASAIYASKHKGKSPVGKKHAKKVGAVKKVARKVAKKVVRKKVARKVAKKVVRKKAAKKSTSIHTDKRSHNVNIHVMSGVGKHFKTYKVYKKHIIDIQKLPNGKLSYAAHSGLIKVPFFTTQLPIAKKFIDRVISLEKIKHSK